MTKRACGIRKLGRKMKMRYLHFALTGSTQLMKLNIRFAKYLRSVQRHTPYRWIRMFASEIHQHYLGVFLYLAKFHCDISLRLEEMSQRHSEFNED